MEGLPDQDGFAEPIENSQETVSQIDGEAFADSRSAFAAHDNH